MSDPFSGQELPMRQLRRAVRKAKRDARWQAIKENPSTPAFAVAAAVQLVWILVAAGALSMVIASGMSMQGKVAGSFFTVAALTGLSIPTWAIGVTIAKELREER